MRCVAREALARPPRTTAGRRGAAAFCGARNRRPNEDVRPGETRGLQQPDKLYLSSDIAICAGETRGLQQPVVSHGLLELAQSQLSDPERGRGRGEPARPPLRGRLEMRRLSHGAGARAAPVKALELPLYTDAAVSLTQSRRGREARSRQQGGMCATASKAVPSREVLPRLRGDVSHGRGTCARETCATAPGTVGAQETCVTETAGAQEMCGRGERRRLILRKRGPEAVIDAAIWCLRPRPRERRPDDRRVWRILACAARL